MEAVMEYKKCPFCSELNETDNKFCVYCGKKFPFNDTTSKSLDEGSDHKEELKSEEEEVINCPKCNALNSAESIECCKCGYLLKNHIKNSFHSSNEKNYKRCLSCGNIISSDEHVCGICGYDLSDLNIDYNTSGNFFEEHPQYSEYGKNLDFFEGINKFNDYDTFLFQFKEFCIKNNIDLNMFSIGMVKCPECSDYFSFISPHFMKTHECPHCSNKFEFEVIEEIYCLNCGRPFKEGQSKCECGYEFADVKCPKCGTYNEYTDNYCTSCGNVLRNYNTPVRHINPRGCYTRDNQIFLDMDSLKKELFKNPYKINDEIHSSVLLEEYSKNDKIIDEICSRWWIVSPFNCKRCQSKVEPLQDNCQKCNITHHCGVYEDRVRELKTVKNNYVEAKKDIAGLSNFKWTYKPDESDEVDFFNSLAPVIGESHVQYRQRLLKEYGENCAISYLIKSEWNIYFENSCMNCGSEFEPYILHCPSCGAKKDVPALTVMLNDDDIVIENFPHQYDDFAYKVKRICHDNGGDIEFADEGVVGCPECFNYFHYLTSDFIDTQRCPHCGVHFDFSATIYLDEWDYYGLSYDEYMEQYYGLK